MPGEILKKRREDLEHDLKDIAHTLKIRYDYLKAIEDSSFRKLPPNIYTKGYIRDYAKFLKIDPEPLVKLYIAKTAPPVTIIAAPPPRRTSSMKYIVIPVVLCLGLIVFFSATSREKTANVPAKDVSQASNKKADSHVTTAIKKLDKQKEKASADKKQTTEKNAETNKEYDLQIHASDTTWLSINIDDTIPKEILLKQGENIKFRANQNFSLRIGNAGGVKLVLNGKDLGFPGVKDQVISLNLPHDTLRAFNSY